jgi:hypothetical protein
MPFTLSHAATAVPLHRLLQKHGNITAFVIGTFSPDLPYFLPLAIYFIGMARRNAYCVG